MQHGYKKCVIHARVFSQTEHGNSKNERFELNYFNGHFGNNANNSVHWGMFSLDCTKERKKKVQFSVAIGNWELKHKSFPQTLAHGNSKNEIRQRNRRRRSEESREYRKKQSGHEKKRSPDGLSHPNRNIIIINKILEYFIKKKYIKKYNEIQLT